MSYIVCRDLNQPSTGRRLLDCRRLNDEHHAYERRLHSERRSRLDRRRNSIQ
ncbi:MAG: hypothetical protein ABGY08_06220 [Gammaproteobacteria bacterium]|jgi:hypothetical protein